MRHDPSESPADRVRQLYGFKPLRSTWAEHLRAVHELTDVLRDPPRPSAAPNASPVTVVLLSYGRPFNLKVSVRLALKTPGVERVVVSNNNPAHRLREWIPDVDDPRLRLIEQTAERGPVMRYQLANEEPGPVFLSLDDDIFLHPRQLRRLADALAREPEVPHGIYGQHYVLGARRFENNLARVEGSVDCLNRAYAFTKAHVDEYFRLLDELGVHSAEAYRRLDDDIVVSFCGAARPRIHDLGPYVDCPSEKRRGVALWSRDDAHELRCDLTERMLRLRPLPASAPPAGRPDIPYAPRTWPRALLFYLSGAWVPARLASRLRARWPRRR